MYIFKLAMKKPFSSYWFPRLMLIYLKLLICCICIYQQIMTISFEPIFITRYKSCTCNCQFPCIPLCFYGVQFVLLYSYHLHIITVLPPYIIFAFF